MLLEVTLLIMGLLLIIKGGDLFVSSAVRIAEFTRMPRVVIGSTLVSLATTTPELVVSVMAGAKGESGLAVGNAVGSCICNIGLILGITATLKHVDVHLRVLRPSLVAMFGLGGLLFLMTLNLQLSRLQGTMLLAGGLGYFAYDFMQHARDRKPRDLAEARAIEQDVVVRFPWFLSPAGTAVQFAAGAGIVVFGSRLLVDSAVSLAAFLGIPSIILGLTVVAMGTSLPELVTAVTSSRKSVSDLAVGNILGANIANLSIVIGTAAAMHEVGLNRLTQVFNFPALLLMMAVFLWMLITDRRVTRKEGMVLLTLYGLYLGTLVTLTLMGIR